MKKIIRNIQDWLGKAYPFILIIILSIFIGFLVKDHILPRQYNFQLNKVATETVQAPATLEDADQTKLNRERAYKAVADVYSFDPAIRDDQISQVERLQELVNKIQKDQYPNQDLIKLLSHQASQEGKTQLIKRQALAEDQTYFFQELSSLERYWIFNQVVKDANNSLAQGLGNLSRKSLDRLLIIEEDKRNLIINHLTRILDQQLDQEITSVDLSSRIQTVNRQIEDLNLPMDDETLLQDLTRTFLVPTVVYNREETLNKREQASNLVQPSYILQGQVIVQEGHIIDEVAMRRLSLYGLLNTDRQTNNLWFLLGLLVCHAGFVLYYYYHKFANQSVDWFCKYRGLNAYSLSLLGQVIILKVLLVSENNGFQGILLLLPLLSIPYFLNKYSGLILTLTQYLMINFLAIFMIHSIKDQGLLIFVLLYYGLSSFVGLIHYLHKQELYLSLFHFIISLLVQLLLAGLLMQIVNIPIISNQASNLFIYITGSVAFSYLLMVLFSPYWEALFYDKAAMTLNQLANLNNSLLHMLIEKAPGTYQHSMMVANLAANAVEAIGGDSLFTRVASYYHDVGKTFHPLFFVENLSAGMESPHLMISAQESAKIIIDHVLLGQELLRDHDFPQAIIEICMEHHGTTLVKYFYQEALKDQEGIQEQDFRYPGPIPQSKESAIIMIADSVEAASRSLKEHSHQTIENLVHTIIKDKLNQNQFADCGLTIQELKIVSQSLIKGIGAIYHTRIDYPD